MDKIEPNPHSPFADADPNVRHLIPSFFGALPDPGVLAVAGCGGMAVVPENQLVDITEALVSGRLDLLPDGLCQQCIAIATGAAEEDRSGEIQKCAECDSATRHATWCALCRQDMHDEWWATRENPTEVRS